MIKWIRDHYSLFSIFLTLLFSFRWKEMIAFYDFIKNPEELKIETVDFDLYNDLDERLWK